MKPPKPWVISLLSAAVSLGFGAFFLFSSGQVARGRGLDRLVGIVFLISGAMSLLVARHELKQRK